MPCRAICRQGHIKSHGRHGYDADRFAAETLGEAKPMEEALINLTVKNLSNLNPHPWYSAYHYSHPTPAERISAIRQCLA
jgi:STE24 endopeptidase